MNLCWQIKVRIFSKFFVGMDMPPLENIGRYLVVDAPDSSEPRLSRDELQRRSLDVIISRKWLDKYLDDNPDLKELQVLYQMRR